MTGALAAAALAASSVTLLGASLARGGGRLQPARDPEPDRGSRGARLASRSVEVRGVVAGIAGAAVGGLLAGPPGLIAGAGGVGAIPFARERRRAKRRLARIEEQLIDAVTAIASAVRSGRSLAQALVVAAEEVGDPLGAMLAEAAASVGLGVPLDDALETLGVRIGGADARLMTGVLRLHRRTGGTLASSLDDLTRTLRGRRDGARELRSLTAQARLSAAILGLLPLGFFLFLSVVARRDVESAYHSTTGASAIGVGLALQGAAFVWIRHLLRVEDA